MEPKRKREGDVWDRRQESRMTIGTALMFQRLAEGWCYVVSDFTEGYAKCEGIFACGKKQYEEYRKRLEKEYQVVIKAGKNKTGQYLRVGTVLPVWEKGRKRNGAEDAGKKGSEKEEAILIRRFLPYTERQMKLQMERMIDIPYSWGDERADGMDCSSMVRGFYACFGLFLPRNSEEQRNCGVALCSKKKAEYEALLGLPAERKLAVIKGLGTGALIYMPGHVMIYAGEERGEPRIFHNCDTYTEDGEEHIVRKTVISRFFPKGEGTYLDYVTAVWKPFL